MSADAPLAEFTVAGTFYDGDGLPRPKRVHVSLLETDAGPAVYVGAAAAGHGPAGFEVPAAALRDAVQALPLRELFRVLRAAR